MAMQNGRPCEGKGALVERPQRDACHYRFPQAPVVVVTFSPGRLTFHLSTPYNFCVTSNVTGLNSALLPSASASGHGLVDAGRLPRLPHLHDVDVGARSGVVPCSVREKLEPDSWMKRVMQPRLGPPAGLPSGEELEQEVPAPRLPLMGPMSLCTGPVTPIPRRAGGSSIKKWPLSTVSLTARGATHPSRFLALWGSEWVG